MLAVPNTFTIDLNTRTCTQPFLSSFAEYHFHSLHACHVPDRSSIGPNLDVVTLEFGYFEQFHLNTV